MGNFGSFALHLRFAVLHFCSIRVKENANVSSLGYFDPSFIPPLVALLTYIMSTTQFVVRSGKWNNVLGLRHRAVWIYPEAATTVAHLVQQLKVVQEVNAHVTADEVEQMQDPVCHGPSLVVHDSYFDDSSIRQSMAPDHEFVESTAEDDVARVAETSRLVATHPGTTTYYVPRLVFSGFSDGFRDFDVSPLADGVLPFQILCVHIDQPTSSPSEVPDCAESLSRLVKTIGGLTKIQVFSTDFNLRIIEEWLGGGGDGFSGEIELIDARTVGEPLTWTTATRVLTAIYQQHQWLISHDGDDNNNNGDGDATKATTPSAPGGADGETQVKAVSVLTVSTISGCPDPQQAPLEFTSMLMKIRQ